MLTGFTEFNKVIESRNIGVQEYLAKPISAVSLYRRLVSIIQTPRKFIKTKKYMGPDRRRGGRHVTNFNGPIRRKDDKANEEPANTNNNMSVAETNNLFD